jgi:hypothetical protein
MMAIKPEDVAGMRYAAQIPKTVVTPKPKPVVAPKPKVVAPKPAVPEVPKEIATTLAQLEQEGKDATTAINTAMDEADTAILAGDTNVDEAETLLNQNKPVLTAEEIAKLVERYTKDSISAMTESQKTEERRSAFNILRMEFEQYGLGSLVTDIEGLLMNNTPPSEFGLRLRGTKAYQDRFKGNEARISAGLSALSPAEYVALEDQYQTIMRNAGLPSSYYPKDKTGKQAGFEKFIGGDVSALELEDRISTAQKRVINSNPEVTSALKQFYPDITDGDILAYTLDPSQGLESIKRKVTAAEIGGAAMAQTDAMGKPILTTSEARARELAGYGVDKASATEGYSAIGAGLQRGSELAAIYKESPYTQATAESEIFKLSGQQEARKQRQKVTGLEKATFGGQSGLTSGALARDRAGGY